MSKTVVKVKTCWNACPYFTDEGHLMSCEHPYFDDKPAYENLIITHENSRNGIPELCPLRLGPIEITKTITL